MSIESSRLYDGIINKNRPIVQKECLGTDGSISRTYYSFVDYSYLGKWYRSLPIDQRHVHEVIPEGRQKFKLDLECQTSLISATQWNDCVSLLIDVVCALTKSRNYTRFESVDDDAMKYSEHVVFNGFYLEDNKKAQLFMSDVMVVIAKIFDSTTVALVSNIVDFSVYKSKQNFRMEGSTKINSNRRKYVKGKTSLSKDFTSSLVCNISEDAYLHEPLSCTVAQPAAWNRGSCGSMDRKQC
ncbi:unnamed protein product [Sphagnum troendelagicum]